MSQLMTLWYLTHGRPAKAQVSLHIRAVSPDPSLFTQMKYGSRWRVWQKITHLVPLDGCACALKGWVYERQKVPQSHHMAQIVIPASINWFSGSLYEPRHEKTCFSHMRTTSLISTFVVHCLHIDSRISLVSISGISSL